MTSYPGAHSLLTANHRLESWVYADATARSAATGFTVDDVGRIAYQQSDNSYWRLTDDSPITWATVTGGASSTDLTAHITTDATQTVHGHISYEMIQDMLASALVAGANVTVTYDDTANTLTIAVSDIPATDVSGFDTAVFGSLAGHFLASNGVVISLVGDDYTWTLQYADDGVATAGRPVESTDSRLVPPTARDLGVPRSIGWYIDGDVAVASGYGPIYKLDSNLQLNTLEMNVKTAGVGATKVRLYSSIDLVSWLSVGGASPQCTVASGDKAGTNTYPDPTRYAAGTWFRLDIDEIGSTAPKNATVQLFGQLYPEP